MHSIGVVLLQRSPDFVGQLVRYTETRPCENGRQGRQCSRGLRRISTMPLCRSEDPYPVGPCRHSVAAKYEHEHGDDRKGGSDGYHHHPSRHTILHHPVGRIDSVGVCTIGECGMTKYTRTEGW
jgi:hypothetical protein